MFHADNKFNKKCRRRDSNPRTPMRLEPRSSTVDQAWQLLLGITSKKRYISL